MEKKFLFKNKILAISIFLLCILFQANLYAQHQLLDSLTLDTLTAFTSLDEAIKNPDQVIKLILRKKKLKKFPVEILKFTNLQYLDLSKNAIEDLPSEIGLLKDLQYFAIAKNGVEELPHKIGNLTNLVYLDINNNELTTLPYEIGKLEKLKMLDLWSNDIDKFPNEIKNLKNLRTFDLRVIMIPDAEQVRVQSLLPHTQIFFSPYCKCAQ